MAFNIVRVLSLPPQPEPDTMYLVKDGEMLGISVTETSTEEGKDNVLQGTETKTGQSGDSP